MRRFFTILIVAIFAGTSQPLRVSAGTTGALTGSAIDAKTKQPIPGAKVTAASPSQIASVTADATGRFAFLALAPDTYTVSVEAKGFEGTSVSGVTVVADQTRSLSLETQAALRTIGRVTSRATTSLVRPGTTADIYSVDATQQAKVAAVGGGAEQNTAYSAVATVPGAYVPQGVQGGNGIGANVYIRGGDYDQVGFEVDGVPVNRSFDNYPSGPAASLGQQELQVYTGSPPANAEGQGLAGFINQVIKVGSYPGFVAGDAAIGGPAFYHKASFEIGGATQNRNFSYYLATDGYNQDFRYADQYQGTSLNSLAGVTLGTCSNTSLRATAPSCFSPTGQPYYLGLGNAESAFLLGPNNGYSAAQLKNRNDIVNLHYGIPHKDGTKDDIQFLGVDNFVTTQFYDSTNDLGGLATLNANGVQTTFSNGYQYAGASGVALPANFRSLVSNYVFPAGLQSPQAGYNRVMPVDLRDSISNDQGILKLQFTKTFGSNALFKLYGYTFYSDWLQIGPQSAASTYYGPVGPDYELSSHTRGISGTFSDQLGAQNLLQFQGSYTTSTTLRDNNSQFFNGSATPDARSTLAVLVNAAHPLSGLCYTSTGAPTTCNYNGPAQFLTLNGAATGTVAPVPTGATTCGGGPCEYFVTNNGRYATYNTVIPKFTSASLTDQWRPTSRLNVDAGIRLDDYQFVGSSTQQGAARQFWYNAYNLDNCLNAQNAISDKVLDLNQASPTTACPPGSRAANFVNPSGIPTQTYPVFQPRLGFTYSLNPQTVVRASYGRFTQPPNSAYEQYDALQANAPALLYGTYGFQQFGFNSPDHSVSPQISTNYDFSIEHSFGDTSLKLTPFLRKTQNQIQQFYLNQQTGFVSGLNVGQQTSQGVEFELDKGNFSRDGLAGKLAFTYTNSYIRYTDLPNGSTIIDPLNTGIKQYNAYTSFCATHAGNAACGSTAGGAVAAPCYTPSTANAPGAAVTNAAACTGADIANPYWNAPLQTLLDPNGNYYTYDTFPAGIGASVAGYGAPYFATLVAQYKHGRFAMTPSVQFAAGERYGSPASTYGIAPDQCTAALATSNAGDSRYTYGSAGGAPFDATACGSLNSGIPDPYTKKFDTIGAFAAPSTLDFGTQFQYDVSKQVSVVATLANIVNTCFGGTKTGFTVRGACSYTYLANGSGGDIGNTYNPGAALQPYINTPYSPVFAGYPFSVYVDAKIHL